MPHWLIKSFVHRTISSLPRRQFWNGIFQSCLTHSTGCTVRQFEGKVTECAEHLAAFRASQGAVDFTVLDLGTGWHPIIPLGLFLCGAREIWSLDIEPLLRASGLKRTLDYYCDYGRRRELRKLLPAFQAERLAQLDSLRGDALQFSPADLLKRINFHVLVKDAQKTGLPDGCVDFFFSSGVLHHIPRPVLEGIIAEFRRLARPGAIMTHRINLRDQFSSFDSSITPVNFLRYTAAQWRWLDSPLISQSRLRISDYRRIFTEAGFQMLREDNTSAPAEVLDKVALAPEFRHYSPQDLLVVHTFLTSRVSDANARQTLRAGETSNSKG